MQTVKGKTGLSGTIMNVARWQLFTAGRVSGVCTLRSSFMSAETQQQSCYAVCSERGEGGRKKTTICSKSFFVNWNWLENCQIPVSVVWKIHTHLLYAYSRLLLRILLIRATFCKLMLFRFSPRSTYATLCKHMISPVPSRTLRSVPLRIFGSSSFLHFLCCYRFADSFKSPLVTFFTFLSSPGYMYIIWNTTNI